MKFGAVQLVALGLVLVFPPRLCRPHEKFLKRAQLFLVLECLLLLCLQLDKYLGQEFRSLQNGA